MTDAEELDLAEATRRHHASQTAQLSAIIRGQADVLGKVSNVEQLTWETRTDVAALVQRVGDHDRRIGINDAWRADKDNEVTATGRHNIEALQRQLAERDAAVKARRSMVIKWAAGILGTVAAGSILAWATAVFAGCGGL